MKDKKNTGSTAHAALPAPSEAQVARRVEAFMGRMSLEDKVGQLTQISGKRRPGLEARGCHTEGRCRLGSVAQRQEAVQRLAKDRGRREPIKDPTPLRTRRDPRLPHHLPRAAGHGLVVGSVGC